MTKAKVNLHPYRKLLLALPLALLLGLLVWPLAAQAHPLGNFTVNQYSRLEVGANGVSLFYVLDMAEIPTLQEKTRIDLNQDGQVSDQERATYLESKASELQAGLHLKLANTPAQLKLSNKDLNFLAGQGGLQTLRLTMQLQTESLPADATNLSYENVNYSDRLGWREIIIRNSDGIALQESNVPNKDQSNELRVYPQDMLASPLNLTSAQANFHLDATARAVSSAQNSGAVVRSDDPFAALINNQELSLGFVAFAFAAAFVLGMFHAFSPGHGKTVVGAYLVGSRGTARHALFLGLTVTVTHTIGVFALGLITLFASQFILPEKLYPWLSFLSGLLVVVMGLLLIRARLRGWQLAPTQAHPHDHDHSHDTHIHSHEDHVHSHDTHIHSHDHDHSHENHVHPHDPVEHSHPVEAMVAPTLALSAATAGAESVGIAIPPTHSHDEHEHAHHSSEQHHDHSHDDHDHFHAEDDHIHFHGDHIHSHDDHDHSHAEDMHLNDHDHIHDDHDHVQLDANGMHVHSHGGKPHTHLPPGADGSAITWKKLLIFGISAGLLPCPSALIVMLSAISLNRTAFGLVLIIFFSLGLAGALTSIGLILVYARDWLNKRKLNASNGLLRLLPLLSAVVVTIIGLAISYEALAQAGLWGR